jgi:hypothetical protein
MRPPGKVPLEEMIPSKINMIDMENLVFEVEDFSGLAIEVDAEEAGGQSGITYGSSVTKTQERK